MKALDLPVLRIETPLAEAFPRRLRAWRERNNLSQSEAALKLQISKRTLQEWEQDRIAPRGLARTAIGKTIRA
jgi:DNA-binding transcriptional regulator YiaG